MIIAYHYYTRQQPLFVDPILNNQKKLPNFFKMT